MLFQICIMTQVKNPQVEGDSCPGEGHWALQLGLASRKADLCQREFLQAGPFEEPAHFAPSSAWSTVFTSPLVAGDGSGRYLTTRGSVGRAALSWRGRFRRCTGRQCPTLRAAGPAQCCVPWSYSSKATVMTVT